MLDQQPSNKSKTKGLVKWKNACLFVLKVLDEYRFGAILLFVIIFASSIAEGLMAGAFLPILYFLTGSSTEQAETIPVMKPLYTMLEKVPEESRIDTMFAVIIVLILVCMLVRCAALAYRSYFTYRLPKVWRQKIAHQYLNASLRKLKAYKKGTLINNIIAEPSIAAKFVANIIELVMLALSSLVLITVMAMTNSAATAALLTTAIVISLVCYPLFIRYPLSLGKRRLALQQDLSAAISENISGIDQIKSLSLQEHMEKIFSRINSTLARIWTLISIVNGIFKPMLEFIALLGFCVFCILAPRFLDRSTAEIAPLLFFFTAVGSKVFTQLARMLTVLSMITNRLPSTELVYNWSRGIFDEELLNRGASINSIDNDIKLNNITLNPDGNRLFERLNATIPEGKMTVITGRSGVGKTTILNLLLRTAKPESGAITTGDTDIESFSLLSWRALFGVVSQESFLFNGTIRENILMGNPNATDEELDLACSKAHADEFISSMSKGYETRLVENGSNLSGGQRQRTCLARALIRNPQIYVFDEPTSAIDESSTRYIRDAIGDLRREEKTVIIITHDTTLMKDADIILMMGKGQLLEEGTYESLMSSQGEFFKLTSNH